MEISIRAQAARLALAALLPAHLGLLAAPARAEDRFDRLTREVERIRALPFSERVPWEMKTQEGMGSRFRQEAAQEAPSADDRALSLLLHRLGLAPKGFDVQAFLLSLYSDQVRGLYDPDTKTFLVVGKEEAQRDQFTTEEVVAVHELGHALQDQHFDLSSYLERLMRSGNADEVLAGRSLVEGEAELISTEFVMGASGLEARGLGSMDALSRSSREGLDAKMAAAPLYFRRLMLFPYTAGLDLVLYVREAGGWELVGEMYRDPPRSTEQVLHPERYLDQRDPPARVALNLPRELGGFTALSEDVGGELLVSVFLEEHLGHEASLGPAKGWAGDLYRVYTRAGEGGGGGEDMALWYVAWDTEADAREFVKAARAALAQGGLEEASLERRGRGVMLYLGVPAEVRREVSARLERVTLDPAPVTVRVRRPLGGRPAGALAVEPEIKENRYLLDSDRFVSLTHGFTLPVPRGWAPMPDRDSVVAPLSLLRMDGMGQALVTVMRLPRDTSKPDPTPRERVEALKGELLKIAPRAEARAARTLPGPAAFTEVEGATAREGLSVFRGEALGRTYTMVLRAPASAFGEVRESFVEALKRMTFGPPGQL